MRTKQIFKTIERRAVMLLLFMMLTATTAWADSITYIDENGQTQTVDATQFPSDRRLEDNTWYYVSGTLDYHDDNLYLKYENRTYNLILCDGATLSVMQVQQWNEKFARLKVYGQSNGTGKLNVGNSSIYYAIYNCELTVNGGEVTLTGGSKIGTGTNENVIFNGGKLTATGGDKGIGGNTTINATSGWIKASKYGGSVTIAEGKYMKDETGRCYKGTLTNAEKTAAAGKTLQPATLAEYNNYVFSQDVSGDGSQNNPYVISTTAGWDAFCDRLAADDGKTFFTGKTVKLGADISVTRMAGADNHDFCGTFDGGHKTLTFTATATDSYLAPFRNVLGNSETDHAVIKNLTVETTITAADYRHTAGLIAVVWGYVDVVNCNVTVNITANKGTNNPTDLYPAGIASQVVSSAMLTVSGCTVGGTISTDGKYAGGIIGIAQGSASIVNSVSSVTIDSSTSGDGTHGGLVALQGNYEGKTLNIEGCVFNGSLLGSSTTCCGGFVGWRSKTINISNSLFAPAQVGINTTDGGTPCATFVRNGNSTPTNSYYTQALGTTQGKAARSVTAGEYVTMGHAGEATEYPTSGITAYKATDANGASDPFIAGLVYNNVIYAGNGEEVSLTLSTNRPGYVASGYSVSNGGTISANSPSGDGGASWTLTMPDEDVAISANFVKGHLIGDGSDATSTYLPTYSYYNYSLTEQIYTSEELGEAGLITSIAFYNAGAEKTRTLDFYMKSTDKSSFSDNSDWIAVSAIDKVFSGSVTFTANEWTVITFSNPFIYDGTSNVVLVTDDNSSAYTNSPHMACRVFNAPSQALYVISDDTKYSPASPSSYNGTVLSVKNQLLFTKEVIPTESVNITVSVSPAQAGTVSGGGEYAFGDVCTVSVTPNEGYVFTGWKENGVLVSNDLELSFKATADRDLVATFVHGKEIGEFTDNNTYLPSYSHYNYSLTQQIYTAEEIGAAAGVINMIAFYNEGATKTRTYDLYLKATEKTSFSSEADWVTVAETDKVFSGSVTMSNGAWTTINFTTPFEYDGTSNLVLVVDDNSAAYANSPHMACSVFSTDENQAIYIYNDNTNFDPMSPPAASTNNNVLSVKNHILLGLSQMGDVNDNGQIDIGDAVCIVNYLVNKTNTVFNAAVANLNGNEGIDIGDAVMIVNILVGKTDTPEAAPLMTTEEGLQTTDNHEPQ